jgi:hypothetical protein
MVYDCPCCRMISAEHCRCVFTTCPMCSRCLTHCACPLRHARSCEPDPDLDAADGPFADLVHDEPFIRDGDEHSCS